MGAHSRRNGMRTYGVICDATGFVVYVGHATDPMNACVRATKDTVHWGSLGPFRTSMGGAPKDSDFSWLELSVYDVTGLLDPIENVDIEDEAALAAMTEDNLIDQYIARQG
jgi:hypothetical protein